MANVTFQMIVFQGSHFLEPVLKSLLNFGRVIVTEGPVAYWQERGYQTSTDGTNDILASRLPASDIVHGQYAEKDEMMNAAMHLIPPETTHVWMCDADECWELPTLRAVIAELDEWDSVSFKPHTFYGGFERCMGGFEIRAEWIRVQRYFEGAAWKTHRPPTILAPDGVPWRKKRHWDAPYKFAHYSYVFPSQVKAKIQYYESWGAGTIKNYYREVYRNWTLGDAKEKQRVEDKYNGVHEFSIARRGDARTYPFAGEHPRNIERALPELKLRFAREVAELREGRI